MTKAQFKVFPSPEAVADAVASHIGGVVGTRPQTVLGLATGKTFVPIYEALVRVSGLSRLICAVIERSYGPDVQLLWREPLSSENFR